MSIVRLTKKTLSIILFFGLLYVISCQPSNGVNPTPGPGGSGGDITITSVSPDIVYPDDEIVVDGSGFNTDPAKDTVMIGIDNGGVFKPFENTFELDNSIKVVSATANQLVVTPVDPLTIDIRFSNSKGPFVVLVKTGGKKAMGSIKRVRNLMAIPPLIYNDGFHSTINVTNRCSLIFHPGDSLVQYGKGFYPPSSLYIDGKKIDNVIFPDSAHWNARLPKSLFGDNTDDCPVKTVKLKIINGDGKFLEKDVALAQCPEMVIFSAGFGQNSASKSTTSNINLTINGYSLYQGCMIKVAAPSYNSEAPLAVSSYQNNVTIPFTISDWPATAGGTTYNFFIKRPPTQATPNPDYGFPIASIVIYP